MLKAKNSFSIEAKIHSHTSSKADLAHQPEGNELATLKS